MTFVRLRTNPIHVRNMKAVRAAPRRVEAKGEEAAAGYV